MQASTSSLCLVLFLAFTFVRCEPLDVKVSLDEAVNTFPEEFMSFTMDAGIVGRWERERGSFFYNESVINLAKELSPCFFRFGGTSEDFTDYSFEGSVVRANSSDRKALMLNETIIRGLFHFANAAGWKLIFGTNAATMRYGSGSWRTEAFTLMLKSIEKDGLVLTGVELGNEPDLFSRHNVSKAPTARQLALDFGVLSSLVSSDTLVLGPDVADSVEFFGDFLNNLTEPGILDVATWHFYYGPGSSRPHGLNWTSFSAPSTLDRFMTKALQFNEAGKEWKDKAQGQIWVGETSSTYGGGTANASASFVAGFMWLDKLAIAARFGITGVCRQVFAHASYSVLGYDNLPNPDYFTSILWRRLIGRRTLRVEGDTEVGRAVRMYGFCARSRDKGVAVVYLNTHVSGVTLSFDGLQGKTREVYILSSSPGNLISRDIFLNGKVLKLSDEGKLPALDPLVISGDVSVPAKSYGFVVIPNAGADAC